MGELRLIVSTRSVLAARLVRILPSILATRRANGVVTVHRHRASGISERLHEWRVVRHLLMLLVDARRALIVRITETSCPTSSVMIVGDRVDLHKTCVMDEVRVSRRFQTGRARTEAPDSPHPVTMPGRLAMNPDHLAETWVRQPKSFGSVCVMDLVTSHLRSETPQSLIVSADHRAEWMIDAGAAAGLAVAAQDRCRSTATALVVLERHLRLTDVLCVLMTDQISARARRGLTGVLMVLLLLLAVLSSSSVSVRCSLFGTTVRTGAE